MLQDGKIQRDILASEEEFFSMIQELCEEKYASQPMSDVFHTIRSMLFLTELLSSSILLRMRIILFLQGMVVF